MLDIRGILEGQKGLGQRISLRGWIKSHRSQKNISFLELNDGSTFLNLQVIYKSPLEDIAIGSAVEVLGEVVPSPAAGQKYEFAASEIRVLSPAQNYPIQKKEHSIEWLREVTHLRHRTSLFTSANTIKNRLYQLTNQFFDGEGFRWIQSPIITSNSCEGGSECFEIKDSEKFFKTRALLSVSGQFHAEALALGLGKVYTFGPTFRAEKSNTSHHLAEFWMIEPEISFCDLEGLMSVMERFMKYVVRGVLQSCGSEIEFLSRKIPDNEGLVKKLEEVVANDFERMEYRRAVEVLQKDGLEVKFGDDLSSEQERHLTRKLGKPVFVYNYPKAIKSFYMKEVDGVVVSSVDLLIPEVGELMGGSERESSKDLLITKAKELGIPVEGLEWYTELRDYGYYSSAGFGCGFERLVLYVTGLKNIKDAINYPRAYGQLDH